MILSKAIFVEKRGGLPAEDLRCECGGLFRMTTIIPLKDGRVFHFKCSKCGNIMIANKPRPKRIWLNENP